MRRHKSATSTALWCSTSRAFCSIGLLLCKQRNRLVAEYALRGLGSPMGAAGYHFIEALPEALADCLSRVEDSERELGSSESS